MEYWQWILGGLWLIGAVKELAAIHKGADSQGIEVSTSTHIAVFILVIFTWPYWYFYGKK